METFDSEQARKFYDAFGEKQDKQGFYENAALDKLVAHAEFGQAKAVFEFGCGTGKLAQRLFENEFGTQTRYVGVDISNTMVGLATDRLGKYGKRAEVTLSEGVGVLNIETGSVDRYVSTYVLDLLPEAAIDTAIREACRMLKSDGLLCLASISAGTGIFSKCVMGLWRTAFSIRPAIVGGCRPICLAEFVDDACWDIRMREVVVAFGIASEVLVARKK